MHSTILSDISNYTDVIIDGFFSLLSCALGVWFLYIKDKVLLYQDKKKVWLALYEFQCNNYGRYKSVKEIAKKVDLTEQRVYEICCAHKCIVPSPTDDLWQTKPGIFLYGLRCQD
jgi:hypothetical protein